MALKSDSYSAVMAVVLALMGSVMWGIADFVGGFTSKKVHVSVVVTISQFFGLLTIALYGVLTGGQWDSAAWMWAVFASVSGFAGLMMFYQALSIGRMGIVSPIAALGALIPLAAGLISGDQPSASQYLGIVVAIVGIVFASGPEISGGADPKPVFLAVGAAVGFGTCFWAMAEGSQYSVLSTMLLMRIVTVTLGLIAVSFTIRSFTVESRSVKLLAVVGVFDVLANVAFGIATTSGMLSLVGVLGSLYPVATVLLARFILKEKLLPIQYVGVGAALLGVVAIGDG